MFATLNFRSPTSMSHNTSIEQKTKAKNAAHALLQQVKNGSPKLKNLIREKCRLRIKEARQQRFECSRKLRNDDKNTLSKFLRAEVSELEKDIELQDLIVDEMLEETENWFIEELENELKNQDKYLVQINEDSVVFCPICEKSNLKLSQNKLECSCGINFMYNKSLEDFMNTMQNIIQTHELKCEKNLNFYVEPSPNVNISGSLSCICFDCDYFRTF